MQQAGRPDRPVGAESMSKLHKVAIFAGVLIFGLSGMASAGRFIASMTAGCS